MVGYDNPAMIQAPTANMSEATRALFIDFMRAVGGSGGPAQSMLDIIADVLPIALTVAGSILVVTLGWSLFRNFTRG